jgi:hypothetical protein
MSDFASGWAVYGTTLSAAETAVRSLQLCAYFSPPERDAFAIFPDADPMKCGDALSRRIPEATVVAISTGDDSPFAIAVFRAGERLLSLRLPQYDDRREVLRRNIERLAAYLPGKPRVAPAKDGPVRRSIYALLSLPIAHNHYRFIADRSTREPEEFEGFAHLDPDGVKAILRPDANEFREADIEEILKSDEKAAAQRRKEAAPSAPSVTAKELRDLSRSFARAPEYFVARPDIGFMDLAQCSSPRQWLDARRAVDPARATAELISELERTVDGNRFSDDNEMSIVVKESAAMLLGKALAAQRGTTSAIAYLSAARDRATSTEAQNAWELAITAAALSASRTLSEPQRHSQGGKKDR